MLKIFFVLLFLLINSELLAHGWGYGKNNGPHTWAKDFKLCGKGERQSPIDIKNAEKAKLKNIKMNYEGKITKLHFTGHNLEFEVSGKNELFIDNKLYELKQFHFHTPSENLIRGKRFPLEAHFVNASEDGSLAVIAIFFEKGSKNEIFEELFKKLPKKGQSLTLDTSLSPSSLFPKNKKYYEFQGSLTTPPCSEGVSWIVLKNTQKSSKASLAKLHKAMGNNNRPVQPINKRKIYE